MATSQSLTMILPFSAVFAASALFYRETQRYEKQARKSWGEEFTVRRCGALAAVSANLEAARLGHLKEKKMASKAIEKRYHDIRARLDALDGNCEVDGALHFRLKEQHSHSLKRPDIVPVFFKG